MSQGMITETLPSYKMESRLGYNGSLRNKKKLGRKRPTFESREFINACQVLSTHDTNTPHRAEANRIAEGADRRVKDGTATAMVQSGLPDQWWDCAMECSCNLRNEHDKMADGKTADGKTSGVKLDGLLIPFGAKVSDKPISSNDEARLHCRRRWSGDLRIADCEDLDNLSASGVHAKRFKHQDVVQEGTLLFFCADGPLILFDLPQLPRAQGKPLAI